MRFFAIASLALATIVSAQSSNSSTTSHSTTSAPATTHSPTPQELCLAKCGSTDICCQAACVGVPCPSQGQANATTECAGQCKQGNGSAADTQSYASCQSSCIKSYFMTATGGATAGPSGSASASASNTATFGGSSSASGSSASGTASASGNGAVETRAAMGAGLMGLGSLAIAVLAL